ncbi:MAG: response regulator transcription factor [Flavobacteriales bacterium]
MGSTFLIADDHVIVRRGLRNLLHDRFHASDIQEAATCQELLEKLANITPQPQLLVLDLQMTDGSALDHLERICTDHPGMRVLVYSMRSEQVYAQRVIALGAAGFISKESEEEEVVRAIRLIMQGKGYRSSAVEEHLQGLKGSEAVSLDPFGVLSHREIGVMEDLLEGLGTKAIAVRLGVQPSTVATYKSRLFEKLGVTNVLDLQRLVAAHRHDV